MLWPEYSHAGDVEAIEALPLADRGLPESTYSVLTRAATTWPDRIALTVLPDSTRWQEPVRRTYAELLADVHRVANLLHDLGVRRGDAVALISPNCDELITAILAAQAVGTAVPLNGRTSQRNLTELLRLTGTRLLITAGPELDSDLWHHSRALADKGAIDTMLVLRPSGALGPPPALHPPYGVRMAYLSELAEQHPGERLVPDPPRSEDLAALFRTSGTTGRPKLAAHTHGNQVANAWMVDVDSRLGHDAVVFAGLPLFRAYAVVISLLAPLMRGHSSVWAGPLGYRDHDLTSRFWKLVEFYGLTVMSALPSVYAALARVPIDADVDSLRYGVVGAAPLAAAVREQFESHAGVALIDGFGLTEATCSSTSTLSQRSRPGSVGQRLPYQHLKAVRIEESGHWNEVAAGEVGLLVIKGPNVFPGYVVGHDGTTHILDCLGVMRDGWLNTGDLARIDRDGFIYLAGRANDIIVRNGHNIDPTAIEEVLQEHPCVLTAGAVGRPDPRAGEVPVVYVTLHPGATTQSVELRSWATERIADPDIAPSEVTILEALPLTAIGNLYRVALRADATRRAVTEALAALPGRFVVDASEDDGTVSVTVYAREASRTDIERTLAGYAVNWRLKQCDPPGTAASLEQDTR